MRDPVLADAFFRKLNNDVCVQPRGSKGAVPEVVPGIVNLWCQYVNTEINRKGFWVPTVVSNAGMLCLLELHVSEELVAPVW